VTCFKILSQYSYRRADEYYKKSVRIDDVLVGNRTCVNTKKDCQPNHRYLFHVGIIKVNLKTNKM
jgi:hypothetical protein